MVEHSAVNRGVVGSNPTWGARRHRVDDLVFFLCLPSVRPAAIISLFFPAYPVGAIQKRAGYGVLYRRRGPDIYVYVEDVNPAGDRTILFIHGWPGDHTLFEYQYNQLPVGTAVSASTSGDLAGRQDPGAAMIMIGWRTTSAVVDTLVLRDFTLGHRQGGRDHMASTRGMAYPAGALAAAPSLIQRPYFSQTAETGGAGHDSRYLHRPSPVASRFRTGSFTITSSRISNGSSNWAAGCQLSQRQWPIPGWQNSFDDLKPSGFPP